jgi:hypothetical protein
MGYIEFPRLIGYVESIWFGTVVIGSSQTIPFTISNVRTVDAEWHLAVKDTSFSLGTSSDLV